MELTSISRLLTISHVYKVKFCSAVESHLAKLYWNVIFSISLCCCDHRQCECPIRLNCIIFAFCLLFCTSTVFLCFWMFKWCFSLNMDPWVWLWWSVYVFVSVVHVVWSVCIDLASLQKSCIIVLRCFAPFSSFKHLCVFDFTWLHVSLCSEGFIKNNNIRYG